MNIWTGTITAAAPLVIQPADGVFFVSVLAIDGQVGITGTAIFQGVPSSQTVIQIGETWTYQNQISEGAITVTLTPFSTAAVQLAFN